MCTPIISQVSQAMHNVLTNVADELAREAEFVKRQVKVTGSKFAQTLVLGWLGNPEATLEALTQTAAAVGLEITAQGLDQRFTKAACDFMRALLETAVDQVIGAEAVAIPLLQRFAGVYLTDSSIISLPDALASEWSGCGNGEGAGEAALKLAVRVDMVSGELDGPFLSDGRRNDRKAAREHQPLAPNSLHIADLGYWKLDDLAAKSRADVYWLSRFQVQTAFYDEQDRRWSLADFMSQQQGHELDVDILLGARHRLPARLLAVRVPQEVADQRRHQLRKQAKRKGETVSQARLRLADWTIWVTNVPATQLTLAEALVLARVRWQIELIFKLWKSQGRIDKSRSQQPWRILCELYAKLIAMIIQHWTFLIGNWSFPDRSWVKAAQTVRQHALQLAIALPDQARLRAALTILGRCLAAGCRINKSAKTPRTFQLLLAVENDCA